MNFQHGIIFFGVMFSGIGAFTTYLIVLSFGRIRRDTPIPVAYGRQ